jgi:hypothetical protein
MGDPARNVSAARSAAKLIVKKVTALQVAALQRQNRLTRRNQIKI